MRISSGNLRQQISRQRRNERASLRLQSHSAHQLSVDIKNQKWRCAHTSRPHFHQYAPQISQAPPLIVFFLLRQSSSHRILSTYSTKILSLLLFIHHYLLRLSSLLITKMRSPLVLPLRLAKDNSSHLASCHRGRPSRTC